ncbi:xanthine dehydrogenase family protein molybdopterin-binding subunit [Falsiroseomonas selenitidurans]|uniref:Xanthine dehydrogenase family protein molybdopterin-binding subunit n=1 Tax=Falsiroseomonas selenitidurans TaxID=2716335 RepID=A0ABX1E374_9PROT|nr:xanthine dehydrogenase family protein molybdopterin-binding subunit [Falsiroseomonas selenitidurans]NKC31461.1 xanthine dehydrogenase family protein molybdopterin-binding subunit [Falsiroseomonas selenitidurans]
MTGARLEDLPLLTGQGRFFADAPAPPGTLHLAFHRSPHAHARILTLDTAAALATPGVVAVLAGADLLADGIGGIPWEVRPPGAPADWPLGDARAAAPQPAMPADIVRFVGEAVAAVLAETPAAARDGAEAVLVDWQDLPATATTAAAAAPGAPLVWADRPGNCAFTIETGDAAATASAFAAAAQVVALDLVNPRMAGVPLEPRGALATPLDAGRFALWTPAGKPHPLRDTLCDAVLHWPRTKLRVQVGHIGGGFGVKNVLYPEQVVALWAASRLGRPVRWAGDRSEAFLSDIQGRDQVNRAALALDAAGRILALRLHSLAGLGAYLAPRGVVPPLHGLKILAGCYRVPVAHAVVQGIHSHAAPTCSFRGAGQPEVLFVVERLMDAAAAQLGLNPAELRRRNLLRPEELPAETVGHAHYDAMDLPAMLDAALAEDGFAARRAAAVARGRLLGRGLSAAIEACGFGFAEAAALRVQPDGGVRLLIGTQSSGQGHATTYARLVAGVLGVAPEAVTVVQGDTDAIAEGNGTGACRSLTVGGAAVRLAAEAVRDRARLLAATALEADPQDLVQQGADWVVAGTDRRIGFAMLAARAAGALDAEGRFAPRDYTYPAGMHVAEVEVDPETGEVALTRYAAIHDVGRAVSPAIVRGQLQGGVALGIGQALGEVVRHDATGQVLTASLMDYRVLRAADLPDLPVRLMGAPTALNPVGAKSVGEAGPVAAPPALVEAALDALRPLGVRHLDMPLTAETVWRAMRAGSGPAPMDALSRRS